MSFSLPSRFIGIDEEGFPFSAEVRIQDPVIGAEILSHIEFAKNGALISTMGTQPVVIEAFDEPLVAAQIELQPKAKILLPYQVSFEIDLNSLTVDEWDRFHGYTRKGIPFVLSRKAQAELFRIVDDYDDDSITVGGKRIDVPAYWNARTEIGQSEYWTKIYHDEVNPGWNLNSPAEALKDMLPRLKIARSRIMVLGCGEGHDAAHFAEQGHIVTAVDFSPEAIRRAKEKYGHIAGLTFIEADAFKLPKQWDHAFDVVFEHTCFCAVEPERRNELVKVWSRLLVPGGHLMGVLFAMEKRDGPPYGGSEWEYRQRLKGYQPIFWGRWQKSVIGRQGRELFIYLKKASQ